MEGFAFNTPDSRFVMDIHDFSGLFESSSFNGRGRLKAFTTKLLAEISQGEMKKLDDIAKTFRAKGFAHIKIEK
jgi:aspartyl-tRNA synthetase